jgi:endonuclease YncB( thermonuclease family)
VSHIQDPECGKQPYADEASEFTEVELEDKEVELEFAEERTDQYRPPTRRILV